VVLPGFVRLGHRRPMRVRQHVEHALYLQCIAGIDARDAAARNCRLDHEAVDETLSLELGGVFRGARDLGAAIDAGGWRSDIGVHRLSHAIFLWACDCGVERAACIRVRTMARRASGSLKALWA